MAGFAAARVPRDAEVVTGEFIDDVAGRSLIRSRKTTYTASGKHSVRKATRGSKGVRTNGLKWAACTSTKTLVASATFPVPYIAKRLAQLDLISWSGTGCVGSIKRTGCFPPSTQKLQRLGVRTPH
jgi:hypothetical protein